MTAIVRGAAPAVAKERIELHGPKGLFCLTSPIYVEDTAAA